MTPSGDLAGVAPKRIGAFFAETGVRGCGGGIFSLKTANGSLAGTEVLLREMPPAGIEERRPADNNRAMKGGGGVASGMVAAAVTAAEGAMTGASANSVVTAPFPTPRATMFVTEAAAGWGAAALATPGW